MSSNNPADWFNSKTEDPYLEDLKLRRKLSGDLLKIVKEDFDVLDRLVDEYCIHKLDQSEVESCLNFVECYNNYKNDSTEFKVKQPPVP